MLSLRRFGLPVCCTALFVFLMAGPPSVARADEIEFTNGIRMEGKIIKQTDAEVTILTGPQGRQRELTVAIVKLKAITVNGERKALAGAAAGTAAGTGPARRRDAAEVDAIIAKDGPTEPAWLAETPDDVPATLDLSLKTSSRDPDHDPLAYVAQKASQERAKWKGAVKMLHRFVKAVGQDPDRLRAARAALAEMYFRLKDWPRAAWWASQAGDDASLVLRRITTLSRHGLGDKSQLESLAKAENAKEGQGDMDVIQMCLEAGEEKIAGELMEKYMRQYSRRHDEAFLIGAEGFSKSGRVDATVYCYETVMNERGQPMTNPDQGRARLRLIAFLSGRCPPNLNLIADGVYRATTRGYVGPLTIEVGVKGGRITTVRVVRHRDSRPKTAFTDIPKVIVEKQSIKDVDAVTGATISSDAVRIATAKALKLAERE